MLTRDELKEKLTQANYIYDDTMVTVLTVALQLGRPLLIEGAAGVGKTEVAKVMAYALGRELIRLQCYEGLDESKALYEWNYQKQLLAIQVGAAAGEAVAAAGDLFSDEYMLTRPLLTSIRSEEPVVLLIDEIDKADEEFEAFLLELLSDMQVSVPEVGTIKAKSVPFVVLTSNQARPLSEALRRRCAYLYIPYPDIEKELAILEAKQPNVDAALALSVAKAVKKLRESDIILKKPSIAETLDWAAALEALGVRELTPDAIRMTEGFVLKNSEDLENAEAILLAEEEEEENVPESDNPIDHITGEHLHTPRILPAEGAGEAHTHHTGAEAATTNRSAHTHETGHACAHHHGEVHSCGHGTREQHEAGHTCAHHHGEGHSSDSCGCAHEKTDADTAQQPARGENA